MPTIWISNPLHPRIICARFGWKSAVSFQEEAENVNFSIVRTPSHCDPTQGPNGVTTRPAMNNFYSFPSPYQCTYIQYNMALTILVLKNKSFENYLVSVVGGTAPGPPGGHTHHLNNFRSPSPKDHSCQVWLKSSCEFRRRRWNS